LPSVEPVIELLDAFQLGVGLEGSADFEYPGPSRWRTSLWQAARLVGDISGTREPPEEAIEDEDDQEPG
jgi:hypothetical protein